MPHCDGQQRATGRECGCADDNGIQLSTCDQLAPRVTEAQNAKEFTVAAVGVFAALVTGSAVAADRAYSCQGHSFHSRT